MPELIRFIVDKKYDGTNAGRYLRTVCKFSARTLALLKRTEGSVLADGKLLRSVDTVYEGNVIEIRLPSEECNIIPVPGELDVIYEDEYIVVLNKPAGMPVHPVKIHQEDTLANIVSYRYQSTGSEFVFRAVNRLDRDTTGAVIVAKDRHTASLLQNTEIDKHYTAVCHGIVGDDGTINAPIALRSDSKIVREVNETGQNAVTHYRKIADFTNASLVDLWLETGRTHQIRCHLSHLGHPLFGDDLYGGNVDLISRQALHCKSVSFVHPYSEERLDLVTELPADMCELINILSVGADDESSK